MNLDLPELNRKNFAIARLICAVFSAILLLILAGGGPTGELLGRMRDAAGMNTRVLSVLYWGILFLVLNEIVIRALRAFWLRLDRKPVSAAVIKPEDLRINSTRGIAGIPMFRMELEKAVSSGESGVVDVVNTLISTGFSLEASDIHIAPDQKSAKISLRVHGNLYSLGEIDLEIYPHLVRRIKILSGLAIFRQSVPQDGQMNIQDKSFTARVAIFPTVNGEKVAIRLASTHAAILDIDNIGMPDTILPDFKALLNRSQGMLIITGPTGSGKTTTLFSSLLHIQGSRKDQVNIVTLEDPIETRLEGLQQTQVEQGTGLTFSAGLRSVLRQDPDVIMLGEIRDEETAVIAIRAAMTGHLLLTTVHANSTSGVFNRLSEMGIDPVQLSATVHAVVSQRLCRKLCQNCKKPVPLSQEHVRQLKLLGMNELPEGPFFEAEGCDECLGHGFTGRAPLFEMLLVTDKLRDQIASGVPAHILNRAAKEAGMPTLLAHGLQLAREGKISLMELARVVSD